MRRGARQKGSVLVDLSASGPPPPRLQPGVLGGQFRLEPAAVQALLAEHSLTEEQLLAELLKPAAELARPPISSYHVGAVGLGGSGEDVRYSGSWGPGQG